MAANPSGAHTALSASPAIPHTRAAEINGPATTFASGDTSDSIPNVLTVSGMVAAVAVRVSATADTTLRNRPAVAPLSQASANRVNTTSPATAATESWKPRSNAAAGEASSTPRAATHSVDPPSTRRPASDAKDAATAITHARTAEGCTPEKTTYAPTTIATVMRRPVRPIPSAVARNPTTVATTTRWLPETATRCVRPVVRKSVSASVPASRRLSPSSTPASRAPPSPRSADRRCTAQRRIGPITPRTLLAQP